MVYMKAPLEKRGLPAGRLDIYMKRVYNAGRFERPFINPAPLAHSTEAHMRTIIAALIMVFVFVATPVMAQTTTFRTTTGAEVEFQTGAHASFRANNVCVDPGNRVDFTGTQCDVIVITHGHNDHFTPRSVAAAANPNSVIIGPAGVIAELGSNNRAQGIALGGPGRVGTFGGVTIDTFYVYNDPHPGERTYHEPGCCFGYILTFPGNFRVLVSGDTSATPLYGHGFVDVAFLAIGAPFAMTPDEAATLVNTALRGTFVFPYHDGGRGVADFVAQVDDPIFLVEENWYPNGVPLLAQTYTNWVTRNN